MMTPQVLSEVVSPALVRGVGYALLHSVWQGGALALLLAGVLPLLRRHRAEVRYAAAAVALATLVVTTSVTFVYYYQNSPTATEQVLSGMPLREQAVMARMPAFRTGAPAAPAELQLLPALVQQAEPYLPLLVAAWLLGTLLMGGRLAGGLLVTSRLRRVGVQAVGAEWQRQLAALVQRAGVRRPVALLESVRVAGPLVVGHLRPVILLPLGAVAGLSPALLEALLAHELAHIVRRDYLLNLGLAAVEVLFFYHPAVWFMASCLRAERENCCDDQAAALCGGDRLRVARALAALAELEAAAAPTPRLALAAAGVGGRGSLLARVRRLAVGRPQAPTVGEGLLAMLLGILGLAGLSTGVALASPAGTKATKALLINMKQAIALADTTRKPNVASAAPAAPAAPAVPVAPVAPAAPVQELVDTEVATRIDRAPRTHTFSYTPRPPRRERASTVVIEKDKKGRVVNLLVDGQPVETDLKGKKTRHKEKVRSVEVVRVPAQTARPEKPERSEQLEKLEFNLDFPTDAAGNQTRQSARRGLTDALRSPDLTTEQRRAMEKALRSLGTTNVFQFDGNLQWQSTQRQWQDGQRRLQEGQQQLQEGQRRLAAAQLHFQFHSNSDADQAARAADRDAAQADHDAAQADRAADLADREGDRAELAARRAELRARIAAETAELRALEGAGSRAPRPPRAPRVPLPPTPPTPPMGPQVPEPPAPPAAPNTAKLREALRQDGLIKDEKHFSFQLNDEGGRVNGKTLTPAQAEKYRQLLNQPARQGKGTKSTFSISVDEH